MRKVYAGDYESYEGIIDNPVNDSLYCSITNYLRNVSYYCVQRWRNVDGIKYAVMYGEMHQSFETVDEDKEAVNELIELPELGWYGVTRAYAETPSPNKERKRLRYGREQSKRGTDQGF